MNLGDAPLRPCERAFIAFFRNPSDLYVPDGVLGPDANRSGATRRCQRMLFNYPAGQSLTSSFADGSGD